VLNERSTSKSRTYESLEEIHQRSTSSVLVDTQMYQSVTLIEDVDDLAEEHQLMEDTSICVLGVVDLHIEVDSTVHPGSTMQHESAGDDMSMSEHTVMRDSSQSHAEMYGDIQRGIVPCREETHLGEYAYFTLLQQPIVMIEHLHQISSRMRRDRQWLRAWRVPRPRPPDMSTFTASNQRERDRHRQPVETWCVRESIMGQVVADEHIGLLTVISLTQEQLEEIGSDKLPSLPWDPGVRFVSTMFMLTQVAPESHTLHLGLVWSGSAGTCPMGRDLSFRLIIMIGQGDVWTGTSSTEVSSLIQFLDNRSNGHRYFN
jgi:hypothetical protein